MEKLSFLFQKNPSPLKFLNYGTAGFRDRADLPLSPIFTRVGALAYFRSLSLSKDSASRTVGVMITASHNPEVDNGVKLVDDDGGMMTQSWESYAESFVNSKTIHDIDPIILSEIVEKQYKKVSENKVNGIVIIGRDTRTHSLSLSRDVTIGVNEFGGVVLDAGEVTTPQLHYIVRRLNLLVNDAANITQTDVLDSLRYYYSSMLSGFVDLSLSSIEPVKCTESIIIDCSRGVGSIAIDNAIGILTGISPTILSVDIRNVAGSGPVNEGCGAEFVQKGQKSPDGVNVETDYNTLMCSYDGDADRIIFHSVIKQSEILSDGWIMLDGDKIASLFSIFLAQELKLSELAPHVSMGIVQTAYANGASTHFLRSHDIHVSIAKTGVKYLHHRATEFDVGVYFEANGHGTVFLSNHFISKLQEAISQSQSNTRKALAIRRLKSFTETINTAVGDAVSDMFCVLGVMKVMNIDMVKWHQLYTDLPSRQVKVPVKNKSQIVCSDDEMYVVSPEIVQEELNRCMVQVPSGRCFIRPSGTEDVVRVYAEASTQLFADELADRAIDIIKRHLN